MSVGAAGFSPAIQCPAPELLVALAAGGSGPRSVAGTAAGGQRAAAADHGQGDPPLPAFVILVTVAIGSAWIEVLGAFRVVPVAASIARIVRYHADESIATTPRGTSPR